MLLIIHKRAHILRPICSPQRPLPMPPICLPHADIPLACLQESRALAMALASKPLALVKVTIVVVASAAWAIALVVGPVAHILVASNVCAIFGYEATIAFSHANPE